MAWRRVDYYLTEVDQETFAHDRLSCIVNTLATDDLVTHGKLSRNIPVSAPKELTHCGLVTRYGDVSLGQHWLR